MPMSWWVWLSWGQGAWTKQLSQEKPVLGGMPWLPRRTAKEPWEMVGRIFTWISPFSKDKLVGASGHTWHIWCFLLLIVHHFIIMFSSYFDICLSFFVEAVNGAWQDQWCGCRKPGQREWERHAEGFRCCWGLRKIVLRWFLVFGLSLPHWKASK